MPIQMILFDLDGTLLPMDQEVFTRSYFKRLAAKLAPLGYEPGKLVESIWTGTAAMVKNDGSRRNEEAFWDKFCQIYGPEAIQHESVLDEYYRVEFQGVRADCGYDPKAAETVALVKELGFRTALATNPIFPAVGTHSRVRWAGLRVEDFELCTTYENSRYCKPNPAYYLEVAEKLGCRPEDCLMVGNDAAEDTAAAKIGMQVFLLTDCLINKHGVDISQYPQGGFDELQQFLRELAGKESA